MASKEVAKTWGNHTWGFGCSRNSAETSSNSIVRRLERSREKRTDSILGWGSGQGRVAKVHSCQFTKGDAKKEENKKRRIEHLKKNVAVRGSGAKFSQEPGRGKN